MNTSSNTCGSRASRLALTVLVMFLMAGTVQAAPTFQAAGTAAGGTGAVSPAWPAHVAGDVALLFVETRGNQAATLSTAAGFTTIGQDNTGGTGGTRLTVFWARASSNAMGSPTIADAGDHVYAQIITYRGVVAAGNPWDVTGSGTKGTASTTVSLASVTTTVAQTLVVQAASRSNDAAGAAFSNQTNTNLSGIAERGDGGTNSGNGGGFAVWDGVNAAAGATGATTATINVSVVNAYWTIALRPDVPVLTGAALVCGTTDQVEVQFSIPVTAASAQNAANYAMSGGATVTSATLDSGGQLVTLTVGNLNPSQGYTLTVNNVTGTYGGIIAANSQSTFFTESTYPAGLLGTYYSQNGNLGQAFAFTGTAVQRVDGPVDFDWGAAAPGPAGIGTDGFSVRWRGFVTPTVSGNYTFRTRSDDGVRLYVSGNLVIDNWTDHSATNNDSTAIALTAGQRYPVTMEFYENGGDAVAQLSWNGPSTGGFQFIPLSALSYCGTPGSSPVAFYKMDESVWSGAGAVADSSGNGYNGTATGGAVPVSAKVCNGVQLNGSSRYVQVSGLSSLLNSTASLAFWIKTTQTGSDTGWQAPGVTGVELSGGADDIFWGWLDATGRIGLSVGDTYTTKSTVAINNGNWRHVVLTRDHVAGAYKIYIDGVLDQSGSIATGVIGTAFSSIGRIEDTGGTPVYLDGQLDEVRIYDRVLTDSEAVAVRDITRPCAPTVDHYGLSGSASGVTCDVSTVQITAHDAAHTGVSPAAGTVLTLSTSTGTGVWQAGLLSGTGGWTPSGANNGAATYVWPGGETSFTVRLRQNTPATVNINLVDSGAKTESATEDLSIVFADSALRVTDASGTATVLIGKQLSAKNSSVGFGAQALYLQAIRTDTSTGSCVGLIQSQTVTIELAAARINPTGSASQVSVMNSSSAMVALGTGAGAAGAYTNVSLAFDASSKAPLVVNYPNAGSVSLFARYQLPAPPSGTFVSGSSNTFVVRPFGLRIAGPPAGRSGAGSTVYAKAGQTWPDTVTVSAVVWESADDADNDGVPDSDTALAGNAVTTNFGAETTPATASLTHALAEPSGGNSGTLTSALSAFTNGVASTSASWSEVGLIDLFASSASYLGSGQTVRNSTAGYAGVGRFYPDHFFVPSGATLTNRAAAACSPASSFTYMDEGFRIDFTLQARNSAEGITQNYGPTGSFAKLNPTTIGQLGFGALSGTTNLTARLDTSTAPTGTFAGGVAAIAAILDLSRTASADGPFPILQVGIAPGDSDGVALRTADLDMDVVAPAGNDHQQVGPGTDIRFGRMRLQNAIGSALLDLPISLRTEYYNGSAFVTNAADGCTRLQRSDIRFDFVTSSPRLAACDTVTSPAAPIAFTGGVATLRLTKPAGQREGVVDLSVNLNGAGGNTCTAVGAATPAATDAAMPWLQGAWNGTTYTDNPRGRFTFGVYKAAEEFIYLRENY